MKSRAASMTTLDKLDPSLTGRIRISTMICYACVSKRRLIDEVGSLVAGKPAAKVRERHGHGLSDDRLPGGTVGPAAHRPPGHHSRPGLIDNEPPMVRRPIE